MNTYESSMAPEFEKLLVQREKDLCALLNARENRGGAAAGQGEVTDFKDLAAEETLVVVDEVQAEHAALELEQVLAARRRLQDHGYGVCLDCGLPIDLRRLRAMLATPFCASCQSVHEHEPVPRRH